MEAETLALAKEIDFSMWGLFARATLTVKLVMVMLVISSFWSWSIIIQKTIQYRAAKAEADRFDRAWTVCLTRSVPSRRGRPKRSLPPA
jgi:biopolymer transport protein TolQ